MSELVPPHEWEPSVLDRQLRVGFDKEAAQDTRVIVAGAGGLGSEFVHGAVRKGYGRIDICDPDFVSYTDLNRQAYFVDDIGRPKAVALVDRMAPHATGGCQLRGVSATLEEAALEGLLSNDDDGRCVAVVLVDSGKTRTHGSRWFRSRGVPVIFSALSEDANFGYVFSQGVSTEGACFGCAFPDSPVDEQRHPCAGAMIDPLKVAAGFCLAALDSLTMNRQLGWNLRVFSLTGQIDESPKMIERRADCDLAH